MEVNYVIVQSHVPESMALKDPLLEKVYCYHRLGFASKQKCDGKIVFIVYPYKWGYMCV